MELPTTLDTTQGLALMSCHAQGDLARPRQHSRPIDQSLVRPGGSPHARLARSV